MMASAVPAFFNSRLIVVSPHVSMRVSVYCGDFPLNRRGSANILLALLVAGVHLPTGCCEIEFSVTMTAGGDDRAIEIHNTHRSNYSNLPFIWYYGVAPIWTSEPLANYSP